MDPVKKTHVRFDGKCGNTLIDAKGQYEYLLTSSDQSQSYGVAKKLLAEAKRQISAAQGAPIEWHFMEEGAANIVRDMFNLYPKIKSQITVIHTPP